MSTEEITQHDTSGAETHAAIPAPRDDQTADSTDSAAPKRELLDVDPKTLIIGTNVRTDPWLDKDFIGSIKDRGVREPIIVRRITQGELEVVKGKRRTLGAIEAGCNSVPVLVEPEPEHIKDATAATIDRIIDQLGENQHRTGNTDAEQVAAHQELLDLGLTAGQIVRRTRTPKKRVATTLAVGSSEMATKALGRYAHLTLDQAATIAEFDDDPELVKALTVAAAKQPQQFEHIAQRARDQRAEAAARAQLTERLTQAGVTVIDQPVLDDRTIKDLAGLKPAASSEPGTELTLEAHKQCPGHAAFLRDLGARAGHDRIVPVYVCTDWEQHGHGQRWAKTGEAATQIERVTEVASKRMTEAQKAERRRVVKLNQDWDSATAVRVKWLRQFLARKSAPKDAPTVIATMLVNCSHEVRRGMERGHTSAKELLGVANEGANRGTKTLRDEIDKATPARATVLTLAMLLAAMEDATSRHTYRNPSLAERTYFAALKQWGYDLSEVEQLVLGEPDSPATETDNDPPTADNDDAPADDQQ